MMKTLVVLCVVVALAAAVKAQTFTSSTIDAIASEARQAASFPTHFQSVEQAGTFVEDVDNQPLFFTTTSDFDDSTEFSLDDDDLQDDDHEKTDGWVEAAKIPPKSTTCTTKCENKCLRVRQQLKSALLSNLCRKSCGAKCSLALTDRLYKCTLSCATAMPPPFRSDEKKAGGYVNKCYKKCIKKKN